jgi:hypothetical protein
MVWPRFAHHSDESGGNQIVNGTPHTANIDLQFFGQEFLAGSVRPSLWFACHTMRGKTRFAIADKFDLEMTYNAAMRCPLFGAVNIVLFRPCLAVALVVIGYSLQSDMPSTAAPGPAKIRAFAFSGGGSGFVTRPESPLASMEPFSPVCGSNSLLGLAAAKPVTPAIS